MEIYYIAVSTLFFFLLGIIWTKKDVLNFLIKTMFVAMTLAGIILTLNGLGYIVKM